MQTQKSLFGNDSYRYCDKCARIIARDSVTGICPMCEEQELFDKVRDYIRKNQVTEREVAKLFNLPLAKVRFWIKEGRIEYTNSVYESTTNHEIYV